MKPKTPHPIPLSLFYLRSAPVRDLSPRPSTERRVRPFIIHTLSLRPQRLAAATIKP